jgi:hypothetical protein
MNGFRARSFLDLATGGFFSTCGDSCVWVARSNPAREKQSIRLLLYAWLTKDCACTIILT